MTRGLCSTSLTDIVITDAMSPHLLLSSLITPVLYKHIIAHAVVTDAVIADMSKPCIAEARRYH